MNSNLNDPYYLDLAQLRRYWNKIAKSYDLHSDLIQKCLAHMVQRLDDFKLHPKTILDSGAATGHSAKYLKKKFQPHTLVLQDLSENFLKKAKRNRPWFSRQQQVVAASTALPFIDQSFDFIFSNLSLHWYSETQKVLNEWYRLIKPNGYVFLSTLGPETLKELYESGLALDHNVHVNRFIEMHQLGDALISAGFVDPVIDVERCIINYPSVENLFNDLKQLGASNFNQGRSQGLMGKHKFNQFKQNYTCKYASSGKIPATFEIVFAHAFIPEQKISLKKRTLEEISIPISSISHVKK